MTQPLPLPLGEQIRNRESANLEAALAAFQFAGLRHFLIPRPEPHNLHIGLAWEDASAFLGAVASVGPGLQVSWRTDQGWRTVSAPEASSGLADQPTILWLHDAPRAASTGDVKDAARAVGVQLWRQGPSGYHESPVNNPYTSVLDLDSAPIMHLARTGHQVSTFQVFATQDIAQVDFDIDAVYLWVDGADPAWRARRGAAVRDVIGVKAAGSADDARFRQHDELRYSLRSLSTFAPWIRHVFLVTDQQRPAWLDSDCPRVTVVDHQDLFGGAGRLPTYNSHALAARLHHIDGLAEHYLYLNDDVFFGRRTGAEMWFGGNGLPRFHNTMTKVAPGDLAGLPSYAAARNHTLAVVEQLTGRARRRNLQHGPHPMSRALLAELEATVPDEFTQTWNSQFRGDSDIVIEWLHNQYGYCTGRTLEGRGVRYRYFDLGHPEVEEQLLEANANMPDTFCINDAEGGRTPAQREHSIHSFLEPLLPVPSEFERRSTLEP